MVAFSFCGGECQADPVGFGGSGGGMVGVFV